MREYARLSILKDSSGKEDSWRYTKILELAVLPALSEMLASLKLYCDNADITEFLDIVERGMDYAGHSL